MAGSDDSLVDFGAWRSPIDPTTVDRNSSARLMIDIIAGLVRATTSRPRADMTRRVIVIGRKMLAFADIDSAQLVAGVTATSGVLDLRFGRTDGPHIMVRLRVSDFPSMTSEARATMFEILGESNIAMPTNSYDPTGAFARWNYPTNLTKEQAIELVRDPPRPGDTLPIPKDR